MDAVELTESDFDLEKFSKIPFEIKHNGCGCLKQGPTGATGTTGATGPLQELPEPLDQWVL